MAAGAGEACEQLPQRRPLAPHQAQDDLRSAACRLHGRRRRKVFRRERPVEREMREVVAAEARREPLASNLVIGEVVYFPCQPLRLRLSRADHGAQPRQDQHLPGRASLGRDQTFEVGIECLRGRFFQVRGKNSLGMPRRKTAAGIGRTRLYKHWPNPAESAAGSTDRSPDNRCPCD